MLVALGAGGAVTVDQPVTVGAEWDDALVDLYRAQRLPLLRLAVLLTDDRGTAEDVVQDAFLALQRRWHAVDPAAAAGYLRTSVVNGVRTLYRRRSVARRHLHAVGQEDEPPADLALLLTEDQREVVEALRTLPRRQREVLVLRYWSELSEAEIADALGVARGTVKSSASRGLASLQKHLAGHSGDRRVR
jgi:RNA polymerase sigma-70 factor (sigma-E family)